MKTCLNCVIKHVGRAFGFLEEASLGYPHHALLAIGDLSLAESEAYRNYFEIAQKIRETRKNLEANLNGPYPELMDLIETLHNQWTLESINKDSTT